MSPTGLPARCCAGCLHEHPHTNRLAAPAGLWRGAAFGAVLQLPSPPGPEDSCRPFLCARPGLRLAAGRLWYLRRRSAAGLFCPHGIRCDPRHPSAGAVAFSPLPGLLAGAWRNRPVGRELFPGNGKIFCEKNGKNPKKHLSNPEKIGYNRLYSYQPTPIHPEETPWQIGTSPK